MVENDSQMKRMKEKMPNKCEKPGVFFFFVFSLNEESIGKIENRKVQYLLNLRRASERRVHGHH